MSLSSSVEQYRQGKIILRLMQHPDVHINATFNKKRKMWLQTYVSMCFIISRYEVDGKICPQIIIDDAKKILDVLKNKNIPGTEETENLAKNLTLSSVYTILQTHNNGNADFQSDVNENLLDCVKQVLSFNKIFIEKKANLLLESETFRKFILQDDLRFYCSMNHDLLIRYCNLVDQVLWIDFHKLKKVDPAESTIKECENLGERFFSGFMNWTYQYLPKDYAENTTSEIELPLSIHSFMEKIKEDDAAKELAL
jgi:hypothetical protein